MEGPVLDEDSTVVYGVVDGTLDIAMLEEDTLDLWTVEVVQGVVDATVEDAMLDERRLGVCTVVVVQGIVEDCIAGAVAVVVSEQVEQQVGHLLML